MHYRFVHSILRGRWLIEPSFAQSVLPMLPGLIKGGITGGTINEGFKANSDEQSVLNTSGQRTRVSLYPIVGALTKYDGICGEPGMITHSANIQALANNNATDIIILFIDSPGGEAYGTAQLAETIKAINKPIYAIIDDGMAASAAYWIASATDGIFATKSTDRIGSVGTLITLVDPTGNWEKEGYKVQTVYAPQSTDKNAAYRKFMEDGDVSGIEADLSILAGAFINAVKENRGERLKNDNWTTGKIFYAPEAMEAGLIDGIMPIDQIIQTITSDFTKPKNNSEMSKKTENKYAAIATTVGWTEGHESTDDGLFMNHEEATLLNEALMLSNSSAQELAAIQAEVTRLTNEIQTTKTQAAAIQKKHDDLEAQNTILKQKADLYDALPANNGTPLNPTDEHESGAYENAEVLHSVTAEAMALFDNINKH